MINIKEKLDSLFSRYVADMDDSNKNVKICVDELFQMIYCNPHCFGIMMRGDELSDFLTSLYPSSFQTIFEKYEKSKSSFYTFTCACLKYHSSFFLKKKIEKTVEDETIVEEFKQSVKDEMNEFNEVNYEQYLKNFNFDADKLPSNSDMAKQLAQWCALHASERGSKNVKKLIFVFVCKAAPFLDEELTIKIAEYLNMSFELLSYYVLVFNNEFIKCNKKITQAKEKRTKYFLRKLSFEKILQLDYLNESGKILMQKSLRYSVQKYSNANKEIKNQLKCVSNRQIARITGFSRSAIDRLFSVALLNFQKHGNKMFKELGVNV